MPLAWEPSSERRRLWQVNEACPECGGGGLHTRGRGTIRVCPTCERRVIPPGVAAPYERGGQAVRQVKSQRERDLEAVALAQRKGIMLTQLGALAADKRLHPDGLPVVEWFADEVRAAKSDDRLTELAELLPESGIRRRQGEPAAIEAPDYNDEDQGDDPDNDDGNPDYSENEGYPRADTRNFPAQIGRVTVSKNPLPDYSAELAVREWRFQPHGAGLCGLIHMRPHGWNMSPEECIRRAEHLIAGGTVCDSCFRALNQPMKGTA